MADVALTVEEEDKELARVILVSLLTDEDPIQVLIFQGVVHMCVWFNLSSSAFHKIDTKIDSAYFRLNVRKC